MDISIAALSEVRRPDCSEIIVGDYTNWSGRSDDYHAQGVAVAVSNNLTPMIIEITLVDKRIVRLRSVVSLVSVYAPTEGSDLTVKDAFYDTLEYANRAMQFPKMRRVSRPGH